MEALRAPESRNVDDQRPSEWKWLLDYIINPKVQSDWQRGVGGLMVQPQKEVWMGDVPADASSNPLAWDAGLGDVEKAKRK